MPILMYADIAREARDLHSRRSLDVEPKAFARQMWLLRRLGYQGLSMSAAMPYLQGERHGRIAVITLDHGYAGNLETALPVLFEFGFSASMYVVSGSIARSSKADANPRASKKRLMTVGEIRRWHHCGMEIGAYTRTHPLLTHCTDMQLHDEIQGSKLDLENLIGAAVTQFCYPYGDVDERVAEVTREAGYAAATGMRRGRVTPGADLWRLPRVRIARHHSLPGFAVHTLTGYQDRHA